jgi:hypothetical protein
VKGVSLFQAEGVPRKLLFQRGLLLALVPPLPVMVVAIAQNLSRYFSLGEGPGVSGVLGGEGAAGGVLWLVYGLACVALEGMAIRNLARAAQGLDPTTIAAVAAIVVAIGWLTMGAGIALLGYVELAYPGSRIFPP